MAYKPPTFGTILDTGQKQFASEKAESQKKRDEEDRIRCIQQGGKWDKGTKTCILPGFKKQRDPYKVDFPEKQEEAQSKSTQRPGSVVTDAETGEPKGFINSKGQFVKAGREDIQKVVSKQQAKTAPIEGGTTTEEIFQQQQSQQSLSRLGKVDPANLALQNIQQADVDWGQAITAGTLGSAPSIIGSAATGAAAGILAGGGVTPLAPILGVIGGAVGIWRGIQSNIKEQQKGEIGVTSADLQAGQLKMRQYAMAASRDPYHVDYYVQLYNTEKANLYISQRQLKTEVTGNLNSWMDDGRVQLAKYNGFLKSGGIADIYENKLRISLQMGVPLMPENLE